MRVAERTSERLARRRARVTRLNVLLLVALLLSSLYLVRVSYESRRLFAAARPGAERGAHARHRQRAAEDRAALAGDAAARRANRARPPGDAHGDAGGDAVRRAAARRAAAARPHGRAMSIGAAATPKARAAASVQERQLLDQPAARRADAAVALEAAGRAGRPRLRGAARPGGLRADRRCAVLPEAGRDPLRPHDRAAGQPRPHPRSQRPDPGRERAGALDLGDPEGPRGRRREPRQAGPSCSA